MPVMTLIEGPKARRRAFVGVGAGKGDITAPCVASLFEAQYLLQAAGISLTLCIAANDCHVDDMRNAVVRLFLLSDCEDLIFIDDDVGFPAENMLRILSPDRDIVAGIYPKKQDEEDFPILTMPGELWADAEGFVEVEGVPTGFLRIKRHVLQTLYDKSPKWVGQAGEETPYAEVYARAIIGGRRRSGDYAFCYKAKREGYRIFVDPELVFTHTGQKTWQGSLGAFWKRKHGVEAAELADKLHRALLALKAGSPTAEDFIDLVKGWGNGYSATPEMLAEVWARCSGRVLECGTGLTTLVLAAKGCEVTSLEHDPMYASHIQAMLDRYGLKAEVQCKPLLDRWYDFAGGEYDCLIVDGPPRAMSDRNKVLERVKAPLVIWDDYEDGLEGAEITEVAEHRFAVWRERELV